jgi:hypothetical protein
MLGALFFLAGHCPSAVCPSSGVGWFKLIACLQDSAISDQFLLGVILSSYLLSCFCHHDPVVIPETCRRALTPAIVWQKIRGPCESEMSM